MTERTDTDLKMFAKGLLAGIIDRHFLDDLEQIAQCVLNLKNKFNNTGDLRKAVLGCFVDLLSTSATLSQAEEVARKIALKLH
ncbi:MAG: hypothetical protein ACTSPP_12115 [Candidatus Heimdallarchaeaceae archaeon]